MKSKQILDAQQMQHLQEMGLELDYNTVLSWIVDERGKDKPLLCTSLDAIDYIDFSHYCIPAYTLQDVLDALPRFVIDEEGNKYYLQIEMMNTEFDDWRVSYKSVGQDESPLGYFQAFQLIGAAVRMLVLCYEQGYVKTNKNE